MMFTDKNISFITVSLRAGITDAALYFYVRINHYDSHGHMDVKSYQNVTASSVNRLAQMPGVIIGVQNVADESLMLKYTFPRKEAQVK